MAVEAGTRRIQVSDTEIQFNICRARFKEQRQPDKGTMEELSQLKSRLEERNHERYTSVVILIFL
jgi:hypothetical protein